MKKLSALVLTLLFALSLTACEIDINLGKNESKAPSSQNAQSQQSSSVLSETSSQTVQNNTQSTQAPAPSTPSAPQASQTDAKITADEALAIALQAVGVSKADIYNVQKEYDMDNGVPLYEIEFNSGNMEYNYDIHAKTGAILERDRDRD